MRQMVGQVPVTHCGTMRVERENDSMHIVLIDLHDTLFVPDLKADLFSI